MAATHFSGPVVVGDQRFAVANSAGTQVGPNQGTLVAMKELTLVLTGNTAVSDTAYLPANSRILEIIWDVTTAGNAVTSVTGTAGTAAAGTQYSSGVDLKSTGRTRAHTAAQLVTLKAGIGSNTAVVATATPAGGSNTQGTIGVIIVYIPGGTNTE